ncbi:homospermidine synthase [Nitrosomonas cryotolerans]|uniref:Homospermidine synthase n=1 Tax=Nitrosomonas cryotolerans ATCC 49181 TaxID=1131553 RepID=A0A1N6GPK4_9PROT|nr:saccharopine dehydrogenase NADP-binding domain-containing protein [Nitrosomonas cryotolerans]SFP39456.1 homospermidine synthase [Nitrosomonas cryotolerans]SIO09451.1 homospermidine synthase [Nitrosomonas cryotolerans ATCC 49181]
MIGNETSIKFAGKFIIVGFGCVGQGLLPVLLRHFDILPTQIKIITADESGRAEADHYQVPFSVCPLTFSNYREILGSALNQGDFLLNLAINVSSTALMELCHERHVLYLDACIEPWAGGYTDTSLSPSDRSNYALREEMLALRQKLGKGATAIPSHGANPGLVSHWVKQALLNLAKDIGLDSEIPQTREAWAQLAYKLNISVIQCAERDTQISDPPKQLDEFINTWSVDGFAGEGSQPAELGWGSHEKYFPIDGKHHNFGGDAAIYLERPGVSTRVRAWTPREGAYQGFLITHGESISIADYLTIKEQDRLCYRPTVYYAYHPCDGAVLSVHEFSGKNLTLQTTQRLLMDDIVDGIDELGVSLMGHSRNVYWYGSVLSIEEARKLAPYNNATSLQVVAGVLSGIVWAIENPDAGIIEPDEMPFERVLEVATPYLGKVVGEYGDWTPIMDRGVLFEEDMDSTDPWQFKNFRVT